jgi:UDP-glucose 4-epimerase
MKILITGSSGNIGYFLCKYFTGKHIFTVGVDITPNPVWQGPRKYFNFYKEDILNKSAIEAILKKEKPTHIIHLAYLMKSLHNQKKEYEIDVQGSKNIVEISNKIKSVKQFIEFSSTSAYGAKPDNKKWIKEVTPLCPGEYRYGINKKIVEDFIKGYRGRKDLKFVIVRMCTAIGPSEYKKGGLVELIVKSPFLIAYDGLYPELQLLHEYDLTQLIHKIIMDKNIKGIFNLCPDTYSSLKELVPDKKFINLPISIVKNITGVLWNLRISSFMPAAIDVSAYPIIADPIKLKQRYNYKFKFTTLSGFKDAVRGMKEKQII